MALTINRRGALRRLAAGMSGLAAATAVGRCTHALAAVQPQPPSTGGAIRVEEQSTGSVIWQITYERFEQSNIYCEVPYCSGDSRYFVYERRNPKLTNNRTELVAVELGTWKQHVIDTTLGISGSAITPQGFFYYLKQADEDALDIWRVNLSQGKPEKLHRLRSRPRPASLGSVSADGRYYMTGKRMDDEWKMFGILLVDLQTGDEKIIDQDPYILNPHPQFEPSKSQQAMIQHNRGGAFNADGKLKQLVGPEGATLYLLAVPGGKRTELQVGKPFTTPCTGHEAWIGDTQEVLLTVSAREDYAPDKGNLLAVRAGSPARVVAKGYNFNHVGVSRDGRFFCCDDWQGTAKLVIGSIRTGKTAVVCESKTSRSSAQNTHPHAYLTPDLKWVIFNSDRGGFPHVHAASVPDGMIKGLV